MIIALALGVLWLRGLALISNFVVGVWFCLEGHGMGRQGNVGHGTDCCFCGKG